MNTPASTSLDHRPGLSSKNTHRGICVRAVPGCILVLAVILLGVPCVARAQNDGPDDPQSIADRIAEEFERRRQSQDLQTQAVDAFERGEYARAQELFEQQAEIDPGNFTAHFNLACVHVVQHDLDGAWPHLVQAVRTGFVDAYQLQRDPSLAEMQDDPRLVAMLDNWDRIIESHRQANLESATRWIGQRGQYRTLERLRIECASSHDEVSTDAAVRELELVADFAQTIMPSLFDSEQSKLDPWVVVALPDQQRFMTWSISTFGPDARQNFSQIGGAYDHDAKRLVAMDLGATLRHEFFHVLHWRVMSRRGVVTPIWVQEGLASLVEDCDIDAGRLVPVPSWRTNIAKRLEKNGKLPPIEELAALTHERFATSRPLRQYALARTFFLYLLDRGVLTKWYAHIMNVRGDDPSGLKALCEILQQSPEQIHKDYRAWVRQLPMVAETGDDLSVTLGLRLATGTGEGPVVLGFTDRDMRKESGLHLRDVITAVNNQSTRDLQEFIRVISKFAPNERITIDYRRGKLHGRTHVTLRPRK